MPAQAQPNKPLYLSALVTLTTGSTPYNLKYLAQAITAVTGQDVSEGLSEFTIQAPSSNTVSVFLGDGNVSSSRYGVELVPGASKTYRGLQSLPLGLIFAVAGADSQKLALEMIR